MIYDLTVSTKYLYVSSSLTMIKTDNTAHPVSTKHVHVNKIAKY